MSIECISHVFNLENVGDPTRKLILMGLANHGDKFGRGCFPMNDTLAKYGCCSVRTVQRHIKQLLIDGFIREGDQGLVAHRPYYARPNVYDVAMSEEQRMEWAADNDPDGGNRGPSVRGGKKGALVRFPSPVDANDAVEQGDGPSTRPGDNLTAGHSDVPGDNLSGGRGDNLTPGPGDNLSGGGGDAGDTPRVTPVTRPGDTGVTLTVNEPSLNRPKDSPSLRSGVSDDEDDLTLIQADASPAPKVPTFEDFYAVYPRHTGRAAAERAWAKAIKHTDPVVIVAGAERYAKDPNLPEKQYRKHPATWLSAGCWDDEPEPVRVSTERGARRPAPEDGLWGNLGRRAAGGEER